MLKKRGVKHEVLNAKYHEKEAEIIAQAGKFGAVTIATNMAGRGTDIMLGGNAEHMAKADLRREGFSEELVAESTGHADTQDEDILCRAQALCRAGGKAQGGHPRRGGQGAPRAGCSLWAPSATKAAASTTSCAGAQAARATPAPVVSSLVWRTT